MKFSFFDLSGSKIKGECILVEPSPLAKGGALHDLVANDTALEAALGEFTFYEMIDPDQIELWTKFAVDQENNVMQSDKLPNFVQIGRDWKLLD
ncbi:hypothetical protein BEN71_06620 [Acinetobacter wuhouensis]|uniref:Uncharacterized protein n=1 Tax=Acinetobacter wuhouensis TaxID=1879050 RepID=A0A385C208_9GAMM|nr:MULTISPECIES: hypothetical protein [Acinetobacter]AXQ21757.1 hypothetical protein BEN71_06620 [Acinetobacter wuhouensis]AYO53835.1 hypothetical protein CDG68_09420 [Acinetobacter wuhouensis]RZG46754.1 hypothetical protein EXU28_07960 [Acinetobacter wuhouensis]RZG71714.1 hypothetical protein EXU29_12745 [Acinetobacter wuhouensis]RZG76332.1 hypothetical protein EXE09_08785 [Acinetobacter sp. WCHAc060025]